jgi:hypothetical protein
MAQTANWKPGRSDRTLAVWPGCISSTWTFTSDADVVLRFADGQVALNDTTLDPGCYSGTIPTGAVLTLEDAHGVSFATPEKDTSCEPLP